MRVVSWDDFRSGALFGEAGQAVTVGVFDGVHLGHQRLMRTAAQYGPLSVVTFRSNPKAVVAPEHFGGAVCTLEQKMELLDRYGASNVVLIDFAEGFRRMTGREFLDTLVSSARLRAMVLGPDFRCGVNLDTDAEAIVAQMAGHGVRVDIVPSVQDNGQSVRSTRIRRAIRGGRIGDASRMLGHPYVIDLRMMENGALIPRAAVSQVVPEAGLYSVKVGSDADAVDMSVSHEYIQVHRAGRCDIIELLNRKPTPVA